jgi:putative toxin-antitoxin system antitoxin component (TIGR02293 family)
MNKQEVLEYGLMVFNNEEEKFQHWLSTPVPALGNMIPNELLNYVAGLKIVEIILHRIEYGVYS